MNAFFSTHLRPSWRKVLVAAAAALALTLAGGAVAQPYGGPGGPGGPGPHGHYGHHGHHGGPGAGPEAFGMFPGRMLEAVRAQLNLDPAQQTAWDQTIAHGKAARETGRANHQRVQDAMRAELAKLAPDLAAVAKVADEVEQANRALRQQVRNEWLALYATFTPAQKTIVRDQLQKRVDRADAFRERMGERMGQPGGPRGR